MKKELLTDYVRLLRVENGDLRQLKAENQVLKNQKQRWLEEYRKLQSKSDSLIDAMKCHILEIKNQVDLTQKKAINQLEEIVKKQGDAIIELRNEIDRRKDDANNALNENGEMKSEITRLKDLINEKEKELREFRNTIDDLEVKSARSQNDLCLKDTKIKSLEDELEKITCIAQQREIAGVADEIKEDKPAVKELKKPFIEVKNRLCNKNYKVEESPNGLVATKPGNRKIEITSGPLPGSSMFIVCGNKYYDLTSAVKASANGVKSVRPVGQVDEAI